MEILVIRNEGLIHVQDGTEDAGKLGRNYHVTLGSLSIRGPERESNQDQSLGFTRSPEVYGYNALLAVADGVSGNAGGHVASQLAIDQLVSGTMASVDYIDLYDEGTARAYLENAFNEANTAVCRGGNHLPTFRMATTLTAMLVVGSNAFIAHVGDSRAYIMRSHGIRQVTMDHTWTAENVSKGILSKEEANVHPLRNTLTRAIGMDGRLHVDSFQESLLDEDLLLLCTDGLYTMLSNQEILNIAESLEPQLACDELVAVANSRGGRDDTTVVIARLDCKTLAPRIRGK